MNLKTQKNLAARALGAGKNRVKLNFNNLEDKKKIKEALSRADILDLKDQGLIKEIPKRGISKTRRQHIANQKKKGRRNGYGSRKGTAKARTPKKDKWMTKIRALRVLLKSLKENGSLTKTNYRLLYKQAKGNLFRNKKHMILTIEQKNLFEEKEEVKKLEKKTGDKK
jgi:large subunit ribosomal protein L19e